MAWPEAAMVALSLAGHAVVVWHRLRELERAVERQRAALEEHAKMVGDVVFRSPSGQWFRPIDPGR